ncbi:hypothetical protein [Ruegeria arenilitoris]|uniref:hypothetical protein n=1 Tax=Ruegeria arenilitoris TaxID=1173585 RepID=UPI00147DF10B|nr:hypothetical protein [Ruegeria arenilitoris]
MSKTPDTSIDVERWASADFWTWEEAEYLLVGLDHWKITQIDPDVVIDEKKELRRQVREQIKFHFRGMHLPERSAPGDILDIVDRVGINAPFELAQAVRARPDRRKELDAVATTGSQKRKHDLLSKMFLAIAVVKYNYDPSAKRQNAIAMMQRDAEKVGVRIDDATLRSRLRDAIELLNEDEEFRLDEFLNED